MTQKSFFWDGVSTGDANTWTPAGGYHASVDDYESPLIDIMFRALWNGTGNRGVLAGWANELEVTGVGSPLDVDTGGAIVYGLFYENDAATTIAVPTPDSETRIDRIVIRRDWSAQTARIYRVSGVEGGTAPSLVQSPNTFYDIPLAQASIDIAGTITVTDEREYCAYSTAPAPGSLTNAHVAAGAITQGVRATRTCGFFISSADMERPLRSLGTYTPGFDYVAPTSVSSATGLNMAPPLSASYQFAWDGVLPPGWLPIYYAGICRYWVLATFRVPSNVAGSEMTATLWWSEYANTAAAFSWRSAYQMWSPNGQVTYSGAISTASISGTYTLTSLNATALRSVTGLAGDEMVHYLVEWVNPTSTTDRPKVLGVQFEYTGYTP